MDIMLQGFLHHKREMGALGAVAVEIIAFVLMLLESLGKHILGLIDLHPDFRQVRNFQRGTVFVYQRFDIKTIKMEITIFDFQTFLRKIKCLLDQVRIRVIAQFLYRY
jgi:hypothetical protein